MEWNWPGALGRGWKLRMYWRWISPATAWMASSRASFFKKLAVRPPVALESSWAASGLPRWASSGMMLSRFGGPGSYGIGSPSLLGSWLLTVLGLAV